MPLEQPPSWVTKTTLWRLARCVLNDHTQGGSDVIGACVRCRDPWPCDCRILAEHALAEAERRPCSRPVRNQAYLDLLQSRMTERPTDDP